MGESQKSFLKRNYEDSKIPVASTANPMVNRVPGTRNTHCRKNKIDSRGGSSSNATHQRAGLWLMWPHFHGLTSYVWAVKLMWREGSKNKLGAKRPSKTQRCVQAPNIIPVSARSSRVFALLPNARPVLYRFPQPRYLQKRAILS